MSVSGRARGLLPDHPSPPCPFPRCSAPHRERGCYPQPPAAERGGELLLRESSARMGALGQIINCAAYRLRKAFPSSGSRRFFCRTSPVAPGGGGGCSPTGSPLRVRAARTAPAPPRSVAVGGGGLRGPAQGKFISREAQNPPAWVVAAASGKSGDYPRRNRVGGEKGKKKLKSKDPISRRIKARRGASSFKFPLFFFLTFSLLCSLGAEGSGSQAGGPQRVCREMRWISPERRGSPCLPAEPSVSCAAVERDKGRAPGGAARPTDAHRRGGRAAAPKCQRGRGGPDSSTSPRQPPLRGTRRRAAAVARTRSCAEPGTVPRALRVPCPSPSFPVPPESSSCLPVRGECAQSLNTFACNVVSIHPHRCCVVFVLQT